VLTAVDQRRAAARAGRFLKGSIPLAWIRENIRDPADRLLLVLVAYSDMNGARGFKLTDGIVGDAGLPNRKAVYRALGKLEVSGAITVERSPGRKPVITVRRMPDRNAVARKKSK
jgi:hypothetical protein